MAVERNVLGFPDWLADPAQPLDRRDELCRKMGAFEVMEGRPLTVLQSAYRAATQVSLWLLADGALMDQIMRRGLAPLAPLSVRRRLPLVDTLAVWLRTRGLLARRPDAPPAPCAPETGT